MLQFYDAYFVGEKMKGIDQLQDLEADDIIILI